MNKSTKMMLQTGLAAMFVLGCQTILFSQVKTIKVTGEIKGLDAMQVCVMCGDRGQAPQEAGSAVADKGKFQITFKEDPSLGKRYAIYIPALDDESRNNDNSRSYFFVDHTDIVLVGKIKNNGLKDFDVPNSSLFQEYKTARAKIDFSNYEKLKFAEIKAHADMTGFSDNKNKEYMGAALPDADSVLLKEKKKAWKEAAGQFFASEYELGMQALNQVNAQKPDKGLNVLVFDFFITCSETGLQPAMDKYLSVFGVEYMKQDYYLNQMYEQYKKFHMSTKGAEIVDFEFFDLKGKTTHFGDLEGKYVYANFWDVEDPEFQLQEVALEKLCEKYKENKNIVFVNLSMNQDQSVWKAQLNGHKLKSLQWSVDGSGAFYKAYKIREFPRAVLLDKEGRMLEFRMGVPANPETTEYLELLLK